MCRDSAQAFSHDQVDQLLRCVMSKNLNNAICSPLNDNFLGGLGRNGAEHRMTALRTSSWLCPEGFEGCLLLFHLLCSRLWFLTEKDKLMLAEDALQGCSTETALFTTRPFYLILAIVGLSGQFLRSRGAAVATSGFLACCLLGSWVMVGDLPVLIWCGYLQILGGFITWPDTQSSSWENVSKTQDFLVKTDIIRI